MEIWCLWVFGFIIQVTTELKPKGCGLPQEEGISYFQTLGDGPFVSADISLLYQEEQAENQTQNISWHCQATIKSTALKANPRPQTCVSQWWQPFPCLGSYLCPSLNLLHCPWRLSCCLFFFPAQIFEVQVADSISQKHPLEVPGKGHWEEPRRLGMRGRASDTTTASTKLPFYSRLNDLAWEI